jgi:UDP-N-acetylmuramoylalanine--D-glutamate ligase
MKALLQRHIEGKKVAILGFGREGRSTYKLIRKYFPNLEICIADKNPDISITDAENDVYASFRLGQNYLDAISDFDVIFKSPGVALKDSGKHIPAEKILTQTSLFIENYSEQIIGITGTKGKSTTSSLIYHIFETAGRKSFFVGNIGVPPFNVIDDIENDSTIIFELSAHQLEQTNCSPHIAILLNIYNEHLDYFHSFDNYSEAKLKIAKFQKEADFLICNPEDLDFLGEKMKSLKSKLISFSVNDSAKANFSLKNEHILSTLPDGLKIDLSKRKLPGKHNLKNILAATAASALSSVSPKYIEEGIITFQPLEHRLEFAGTFCGIRFINDSISTIPESTIEALKTFDDVDTLILGGFDRGIDYSILIDYLAKHPVKNIFYTGAAGIRIDEMLKSKAISGLNTFYFKQYAELPDLILKNSQSGKTCLLSPGASSYDQFNNFMERGHVFKKMAELFGKSCR